MKEAFPLPRSLVATLSLILLLSLAFPSPLAQAQSGTPCTQPDEWEYPARIFKGTCRGQLPFSGSNAEYVFYAFDGQGLSVTVTPDDTDIELCLDSPTGSFHSCRNTNGFGGAESVSATGITGWWRVTVSSIWDVDDFTLILSQSGGPSQNDCGVGVDAPEAFSIAKNIDLPQINCNGAIDIQEIADFFRFQGEAEGSVTVSLLPATATLQLCVLAPRGNWQGTCATVGSSGGGFTWPLDETGAWRIAVLHPAGGGTGTYKLSAAYSPPNHAPVMQSVSCSPNPSGSGEPATCSFRATDVDADPVFYTVDWGDGSSPERVPASGSVAAGVTRSASHSWPTPGDRTVSVVATDTGSPAKVSAPRTTVQSVLQGRPLMEALTCTPSGSKPGETVSCSFVASDDSTGVAYVVSWGDGSPTQRIPTSGFTSPGQTQVATHAWMTTGSFTVSVVPTDNGAPPLTGNARTHIQSVTAVPPVLILDTCTPSTVPVGTPLTCRIRATDSDSLGVHYTIDWGDGVIERFPSEGYAPAGVQVNVTHSYSRSGYFTQSVFATDDSPFPLTSNTRTASLIAGTVQSASGNNPAGSLLGVSRGSGPGGPAIDATWIELDAPGRGDDTTPVRLQAVSGDLARDLDIFFYDASMQEMTGTQCDSTGPNEECNAPLGARWALLESSMLSYRVSWRFTYVH